MQSTNKPRPPVRNSMDVCDLGGGSGPTRLHTGGANILWVKKNHHTKGDRLQIVTYNVRTLLKDEHVHVGHTGRRTERNNMKWIVIGLGEVRRKAESFTTAVPLWSRRWTSRCRRPRKQLYIYILLVFPGMTYRVHLGGGKRFPSLKKK